MWCLCSPIAAASVIDFLCFYVFHALVIPVKKHRTNNINENFVDEAVFCFGGMENKKKLAMRKYGKLQALYKHWAYMGKILANKHFHTPESLQALLAKAPTHQPTPERAIRY